MHRSGSRRPRAAAGGLACGRAALRGRVRDGQMDTRQMLHRLLRRRAPDVYAASVTPGPQTPPGYEPDLPRSREPFGNSRAALWRSEADSHSPPTHCNEGPPPLRGKKHSDCPQAILTCPLPDRQSSLDGALVCTRVPARMNSHRAHGFASRSFADRASLSRRPEQ
ncbi:hypothetical protein K466DRAFT_48736 [Polyporus arcularius HHB13444]|uniref:Uncharacterized protein n=1 Tax=Polyporus arcularius HHB13444 TaxID=1314778 RepID=A0A5C3Q126_9APHY|nr:hypothetical protein K466DRAFT_48736 [Polyporus arcularius HHB13444]